MKKIIAGLMIVIVVAGGGYLLIKNNTGDTQVSQDTPKVDTGKNEAKKLTVKDENLEGAIVSSFPIGKIPLYDGTITSSSSSTGDQSGNPEWNVSMTTDDSIEAIDTSIRSAFSSNGWAIASEIKQGNGYLLIARNSDWTVSVTYNDMLGPMRINYGVTSR